MSKTNQTARFHKLHVKGTPVVLYNAWDAGSAQAIVEAGSKVIATSSWAIAAAQGYKDGEEIPLDFVERIIAKITESVDVPVSVDIEGGYSDDKAVLAKNVTRLLDLGIVGVNFEDRVVKGSGLYSIEQQAGRIAVIRSTAAKKGIDLFINARTDLFLGRKFDSNKSIREALDRAKAYADAGASGFFIPGLTDAKLIGRICDGVELPVNVMVMDGVPTNQNLSKLGVARISYGPGSYIEAMEAVTKSAAKVLS